MQPDHNATFTPIIKGLTPADLSDAAALRAKLRVAVDGELEICYAPLDHVNVGAKVVIVGITPGHTQMVNAVVEYRRQLIAGAAPQNAMRSAKLTAAFSGAMRPNLIQLLDGIGLQEALGIETCGDLFDASSTLAQTTSVLRNPVFLRGGNYNGTPNMVRHPLLRSQVLEFFAKDIASTPDAIFVPLGDRVAEALRWLASAGHLKHERIFDGLPHPSGANSERIAYFLGRKSRSALSPKTNPDNLDRSRELLVGRVAGLRRHPAHRARAGVASQLAPIADPARQSRHHEGLLEESRHESACKGQAKGDGACQA